MYILVTKQASAADESMRHQSSKTDKTEEDIIHSSDGQDEDVGSSLLYENETVKFFNFFQNK